MRSAVVVAVVALAVATWSSSLQGVAGAPAQHAQGAVFAVDVGSAFLKVAAPKFNSSIDIVLNEQSRRKSPTMVGFRKGNRYVAEEAKSLAGRFPTLMVPYINRYAGVIADEAQRLDKALNLGLAPIIVNKKRGVVEFDYTTSDPKLVKPPHRGDVPDTFAPEELLGMALAYVKEITTADVGEVATSAVIAVPHFFSERQRESLIQGAEASGVKVLGLVHSLTAAAFQFGLSRGGFGNDTVAVVIVDIGASKTDAGFFAFSSHPPPPNGTKSDVRVAESLGVLTTLAVDSLVDVGGASVDQCIAEKILDAKLVAARGPQHSIVHAPADAPAATLPTRKFALLRAANILKEALSINPVFAVTIEAADADGQEFEAKATREEVNEACINAFADSVADLVERVITAGAAEAVKRFGPEGGSALLSAVELVGASSRVPAVSTSIAKRLSTVAPHLPSVSRRLNADEAVVLGAAFLAAKSNPYLRFKGFAIRDVMPCASAQRVGVVTKIQAQQTDFLRPLFPSTGVGLAGQLCSSLPCRSSVAVRHEHDSLFLGVWSPSGYCYSQRRFESGGAEGGVVKALRITAFTDVVASALNNTKYSISDVTLTTRVEFSLTTNGVLNVSDSVLARASLPKTAAAESDDADTPAPAAPPVKKPKQKRHHYATVPTPSPWVYKGKPLPLTPEELLASTSVLDSIERLEEGARAAAIAKNNLETLLLDDGATAGTDPEVRKQVAAWLEGRGAQDDCAASEYEAQRVLLTKPAEPREEL